MRREYSATTTGAGSAWTMLSPSDWWQPLRTTSLEAVPADRFAARPAAVDAAWDFVQIGTGSTPVTFIAVKSARMPISVAVDVEQADEPAPPPLQERLITIRASLGLTHADLARFLRVSRKSLYGWADGSVQPHASKFDRIARLERLAAYWNSLSSDPAGAALKREIRGRPVWRYLADNTPNTADACLALRELARQMREEQRDAKPSLADRLRAMGFEEPTGLTALDDFIR